MHTYSTDNDLRPRVYWALSLASYFLAGGIGSAIALVSNSLPIGITVSVGVGAAYKGVLLAYNKWLWNSGPVTQLNVTKVPDLNGEWEGWLKTSYTGHIPPEALHPDNDPSSGWQTLHATLHIDQTWRKINIHLETEQSESDSNGATILTDEGRWPSINYQYQNGGSPNPNNNMSTHDGTADLKFKEDPSGDTLEGLYYTGPGRGNSGKMWFKRKGQ